ncbi:MAG TPA: hypothetical protein VGN34_32845 [Ktedonobacteraceae bacterium]
MFYTKSFAKHFTTRFPWYGIAGIVLCLVAWMVSWLRIGPFYRYSFFPQWFGYILCVDALVRARHGTSLIQRMRWRYVGLFVVSSLFWWIFEFLNEAVKNWHYILDGPYTPLAYFLLASLSFSTVLPAVMETAELLWTHKPLRPRLPAGERGPRISLQTFILLEIVGLACFILPWIFPQYCFGLVWLSLIFLLDPLNNFMGRKSMLAHLLMKDWHFSILPFASLTCGVFWEMWNFFALPKWQYTVPYIGFWKVFEMPLLGYSGYLPFALELFALYQFVLLLIGQKEDYLVF